MVSQIAFTVLHSVTLTIKDGGLHGIDHLVQSRGNLKFTSLHSKLLRDIFIILHKRDDYNKMHKY